MPESGPPQHLDPSELGNKEYWDTYYSRDLQNLKSQTQNEDTTSDSEHDDDDELGTAHEGWFSDVNAPEKILRFLTSKSFPLSPQNLGTTQRPWPTVLDVGTGNGSMLSALRSEGGFHGSKMVGIDYSERSVELARTLAKFEAKQSPVGETLTGQLAFEVYDIFEDASPKETWWESSGWDLVIDKGTFDAISLSSDTVANAQGRERRVCELYPRKVKRLVKAGGFLVVTSCNWTEEEVIRWFTDDSSDFEDDGRRMEVFGRIAYPRFKFGGAEGQGVCTVCFRRNDDCRV